MTIVPTILCQTKEEIAAGLKRWEDIVEMVQIDFADGEFVPNRLPEPTDLNQLETTLRLECHLMVKRPESWVDTLLQNERVAVIVTHVEAEGDVRRMAESVHQSGRLFGLAVRPETSLSFVEQYLEHIDQVLLLGVNPGFNGSSFLPSTVDKVRQLRSVWAGRTEVDGGMTAQTAPLVAAAGATQIAVGSFLQQGDAAEKMAELEAAIGGGNQ